MMTCTSTRCEQLAICHCRPRSDLNWSDRRNALPQGLQTLPSGRAVYNTGRVLIGITAGSPPRDQGVHADAIQNLLIDRLTS